MATIYDVAQMARVSPKTVSRVLNRDAPVRAETRRAVEAAMVQLGYVPSTAARTMRSNRSGLVGLITGALSGNDQPTEMAGLPELVIVRAVQREMAASRLTLMIADTGGRAERVAPLIRTFMEHRAEGLIYVAAHHQRVALPDLPDTLRLVLANCFDDRGRPAVVPDDAAGQHDLVADLIARGHRRIAYLTLSPGLLATEQRTAGYARALCAAGIGFDPDLVVAGEQRAGDDNAAHMLAQVRQLMALPAPPTVICCGNDRMAMRLYGVLRSLGLAIPQDISVAGYDDYRLIAETLYPQLTTAELPYDAMGVRAAARLLALIDGDGAPAVAPPEAVRGAVVPRHSVTTLNPET